MKDRRRTFLSKLLLGGFGLGGVAGRLDAADPLWNANDRASWVALLTKVTLPVLSHLANNRLKERMAVEGGVDRRPFTHLEAVGRALAGIAPWLQCGGLAAAEENQRRKFADLVAKGLSNVTDPAAADRLDFTAGAQNLVDAAFLSLGLARARKAIWAPLDRTVQDRLITALQSTRKFKPGQSNWLLSLQ